MKKQLTKNKWRYIFILFIVALLVKLSAVNSHFVEQYYSNGLYIFTSNTLRILFGWLPFSIGDLLYAAAVIWLLVLLVRFILLIIKKKITKQKAVAGFRGFLQLLLIIYIIFNVFWGLNYNREGIAYQLQLHPQPETKGDLYVLTNLLQQKLNGLRGALPETISPFTDKENLQQAMSAYEKARIKYPFLNYTNKSVKVSVYSSLCNYLGIAGYYNPFSGEAQTNNSLPAFLIPYVTCHEMAHQLGYATEDEANFVGYLTAKSSSNLQFQYSVYFDLFNYANSELFAYDSLVARANYMQLDTLVKKDIHTYRTFLKGYRNPLEPLITSLYGNYLKANNQPKGIETYDNVIEWLISYRKKYGQL